jgi:hypothetical protein
MAVRIVNLFALILTALALVPYGAHLAALPNKIGMTEAQYYIAQSVYNGWAWFGAVLFPAMLINIVFAIMLRGEGWRFVLAVLACLLMATTLFVFFTWTQPANAATQNWTLAPADWAVLRRQWEFSHAANAVLNVAAFCLIAAISVAPRR